MRPDNGSWRKPVSGFSPNLETRVTPPQAVALSHFFTVLLPGVEAEIVAAGGLSRHFPTALHQFGGPRSFVTPHMLERNAGQDSDTLLRRRVLLA